MQPEYAQVSFLKFADSAEIVFLDREYRTISRQNFSRADFLLILNAIQKIDDNCQIGISDNIKDLDK